MYDLSDRQWAILRAIARSLRERGYPPSVREIGKAVGLSSTSSVHFELNRLVQKGMLEKDPERPRALRLSAEGMRLLGPEGREAHGDVRYLPLVGKVTAGRPITAVENIEGYLPFPAARTPDDAFLLRVEGDSMILAGIHDGDLVIVEKTPHANPGDIVVAMTEDGEATVKRFYPDPARGVVRLAAENPNYPPMELATATVLGRVVGLIRFYDR